jgi:hypothetical protein
MRNFSRDALRNRLQRRYDTSGLPDLQRFYGEQMAYGHREVLLEYLNLSKENYFKAVITHGKILPDEIDPILPIFDNFGRQIMQVLWRGDAQTQAANKGVNAISIGATGIYAMLNKGYSVDEISRNIASVSEEHSWSQNKSELLDMLSNKKILYMPVHSWDGDVIKRSLEDIEFLCKLDSKNIVVCLGFLDFADPECRYLYTSAGFRVECAGVRASKIFGSPAGGREKFLYSLIDLIEQSDFVLADELTTGQLYAACLGKHIGILPINKRSELSYSKWRNSDSFQKDMKNQRDYFSWLSGQKVSKESIYKDVSVSLGLGEIKSPDVLIESLPLY